MAEVNTSAQKPQRAGVKRCKKQTTRIDLTPMVDLGFLLLTFFVFTTTLATPKTMDIVAPAIGEEMPVAASGAMTIIADEHDFKIYRGELGEGKMVAIAPTGLRGQIVTQKHNVAMDKLMFIIKSTEEAKLKDVVKILDELAICDVPKGHYAETNLTDREIELMKGR